MDLDGVKIQDLCRVCVTEDADMVDLFSERRNGLHLAEMLSACIQSPVDQSDALPSNICLSCTDRLYSAYEFCQLARTSATKYREIIGSSKIDSWAGVVHDKAIDGPTDMVDDLLAIETSSSSIKAEPLEAIDSAIVLDPLEWTQVMELPKTAQIQKSSKRQMAQKSQKTTDLQKSKCPQKPKSPRKSKTSLKSSDGWFPVRMAPPIRRKPPTIKITLNKNKITEQKKFECYLCKTELKSFEEVQTHLQQHAEGTPLQCQICSMRYSRKGLKEHLCRGRSVQCDYCPDVFHTTLQLLEHLESHRGQQKSNKCRACGQRFAMKFLRDVHRSAFDVTRPYQCDHCCKQYSDKHNLKKHDVTHSKLRRKFFRPFEFRRP